MKKHTNMSPQTLRIALILLCAGLYLSCRQARERTLPDFDTVESIMWAHPDSALALLERMPKPSPDDKLNNATWCLLYTQAWDKNYRRHTSDSLVNIALRYFDKREDGLRKAQVWFYKGSVLKDLGKLEEATECYVRARDLTASFDDPLFASLICQTLGRIYREQDIYGKAFDLFREAIHHVTQVPRSKDWSHAYSELGRTFAERDQLDSARHYFELSLKNAELIKDLRTQAMAIGELGTIYRIEKNYTKALEFEKKDLALTLELGDTINFSTTKYSIASTFYQMGELDSAEIYFKKSLNTSNINRIKLTNHSLYLIAKKQNKFKEATDYIEQYIHYNDSLNNIDRLRAIAEAQEKYDNEKLENEKKSLMLEKERLQRAILRGGIVVALLVGSIAFGYQRKLWLKERRLRKSEEEIQEYLANLHENEEMILQKQALIQSLSRDLEDKANLEEMAREQLGQIGRLRNDTEFLRAQNLEYKKKIDDYARSASQNEDRIVKLEKLSDQNLALKSREAFLVDYIYAHTEPFRELRINPRKFNNWALLYERLDILHDRFLSRLRKDFPTLGEMDIRVCGLIKAGFSTSEIAEVLCVAAPSVTKRKYRIRERVNQARENTIDQQTALDLFLMTY